MKKYFCLIVTLLLVNISLSQKNNTQGFNVDYKPILYIGFENRMYVNVSDIKNLSISSDNVVCSISEKNTIVMSPKDGVGIAIVNLTYKNTKKSLKFFVQEMPSPILKFRGITYPPGKDMPLSETFQITEAGIAIPGFVYDCVLEILGMELDIIRIGGGVQHFTITGNNLKNTLKSARIGDIYVFSNIRTKTIGVDFATASAVIKIVRN